ncbi:MAG: alpha-amylase, partial [Hyphomicrobiales bacterium]
LSTFERFAEILGRRLGEMHVALSQTTDDEAFAPVPADSAQVERWTKRVDGRIQAACDNLKRHRELLGEAEQALADGVLQRRAALSTLVRRLCEAGKGSLLHRIHGDFHLGQTLVASGDVMIIDFEGEPSQPLAERRAKDSGWRDVAGILRSFDYALAAARRSPAAASNDGAYATLATAFKERMPQTLLQAYSKATGAQGHWRSQDGAGHTALLDLFMLEKAAYEINYEVSNRPDWLGVPLRGLTDLMDRLLSGDAADD